MNKTVICLLPARNAAEYLHAYFENVRHFADGVLALDDGSTDLTASILKRTSLVLKVLSNPKRETYAGWDDAQNRQRLLTACGLFAPAWVIWLDADELIAPPDIPLLQRLISDIAQHGHAYAFEVLRMIGDLGHFDLSKLWVYRFFAFGEGQHLPTSRLHFRPIPTDIPLERQHRTIIRILHRSSVTAKARRARFEKYCQADPDRIWQPSYGNLLAAPGHKWELRPHPEEMDILL
jgi:glycosyltransferase involved in cell wall biosynthesis